MRQALDEILACPAFGVQTQVAKGTSAYRSAQRPYGHDYLLHD
jgi:hypothetical protein